MINNKKILILSIIGFLFVLICAPLYYTYAEDEIVISDEYKLKAVLYDTSEYSSGTGTTLTEEGVIISDWQYNTSKYLQIDPTVPADGNTYKVIVELPQEFYVVGKELKLPNGYDSVDFIKNSPISVNNGSKYNLEDFSGTIEYTMGNLQESGSIQLEIRYDFILWDKFQNSQLTPKGISPIKIKLEKIDSETSESNILTEKSVSQATAGSKLPGAAAYDSLTTPAGSGSSSYIGKLNDKIIQNVGLRSLETMLASYFEKIKIEFTFPKYTDENGNVYYLSVMNNSFSLYSGASQDYTIEMNEDKMIVSIPRVYFTSTSITLFSFRYNDVSDMLNALEGDYFTFSGGIAKIYVDGKNGVSDQLFASTSGVTISYNKALVENIVATSQNKTVSLVERPVDAVSQIAGFYLENKGTADSGAKTITWNFDTSNTGLIKVTTMNVFADNLQPYIDVSYTLVDEYNKSVYFNEAGERVSSNTEGAINTFVYSLKNYYYNKTTILKLCNQLNRSMLPIEHQQYYFKTVTYTIKTIKTGTKLYAQSANATINGPGNIYGYVDDSAVNKNKVYNQMIVKSVDENYADLIKQSTTTLTNSSNVAYQISSASMSQTSIQAGESLKLNTSVQVINYPYGNSTWLKGITVGLLLPQGVSVNEHSIIATYHNGEYISGIVVEVPIDVGNGNYLWKINLPNDVYIGYPKENLSGLTTSSYTTEMIHFSIQLDTDYSMNTSTLFAPDMFYVTGYKQTNAAGGSFSYAKKNDEYDLNQNGSTTDIVGGIDPNSSVSCQITAHSATLDVFNNISVTHDGIVSIEGYTQDILSYDDIITYNLDIGCSNGGTVNNFKYYIPVPNLGNIRDDFFISSSINDSYDVELIDEAILSGTNIFMIEYTFDTGLNYESVSKVVNWVNADYIRENNLNFKDVTMIRITSSSGIINNGDSSRISINLKYKGNTYNEEAGKTLVWSSGGYFSYINNGREVAGNFNTDEVSVRLTYSQNLSDIVLTASKDMTPQIAGNVNELYVRDILPQFIKKQSFIIKSVETYNVKLQTKDYIINNTNMSGVNANQTYGVTVLLNDGTESDIMVNEQTNIGVNNEDTSPKIKFKLYNADSLSDNIQSRYIVVTLGSDNGVTLKQKIIINREITKVEEISPSIVSGNIYTTLNEISTNVNITQDSSFTAQFATEYIANLYDEQKMLFSTFMPIGTKITLVSTRDSSNPTYWYYIVSEQNINEISLSDFVQMGKINDANYTYLDTADTIKEQFLVIIDFTKNTSYLSEGTYSIKLSFNGIGVDDFNSTSLNFSIKNKRTFNVVSSVTEINVNQDFEVSYNLSDISSEESNYLGKKLSLVVSSLKTLPLDSSILVNDTDIYYLNNDNEFIIPLNDVSNGSGSVKLKLISNMLSSEKEEYDVDVDLWISSTANPNLPKLGNLVAETKITIINPKISSPSLKIIDMDERIIKNISGEKKLSYQYIDDSDCTTKVEFYQKVGNGYQKLTNGLNQVNGNTTHTMGTFDIESMDGINDMSFMLSSILKNGTYRIVITIYNNNGLELISVPYNFIIST